jgi:hypothetical protein
MKNVSEAAIMDHPLPIIDAGDGCRVEVGLIESAADLRGFLGRIRPRPRRVIMMIQCSSVLLEEYLNAPDPNPVGCMNHFVLTWVSEEDKAIDQNRLAGVCSGRYATLFSVRHTTEAALATCLSWLRSGDTFFVLWPKERGLPALAELLTRCRATHKALRATVRGG